jgi:hypothetical protein
MWNPLPPYTNQRDVILFLENLKRIKQVVIRWAHENKKREEGETWEIELRPTYIQASDGGGFLVEEEKVDLVTLEKIRRTLLDDWEAAWRLKS